SSLTQTAFASAGIDLPRVSADQYAQAPSHDSLSNVQPGDLIFWSSNGSSSGIYHVAVYIGDGQIAQARNPQAGISIDSLDQYKQYNPPMNSVARYYTAHLFHRSRWCPISGATAKVFNAVAKPDGSRHTTSRAFMVLEWKR